MPNNKPVPTNLVAVESKIGAATRVLIGVSLISGGLLVASGFAFVMSRSADQVSSNKMVSPVQVSPKLEVKPQIIPKGEDVLKNRLQISLSQDTRPADYLVMGETSQLLAKFKLRAEKASNDLVVERITFADASSDMQGLINLKLFSNSMSAPLGLIVDSLGGTFEGKELKSGIGIADFNNLGLVIPKSGEAIEIWLTADINSYPLASSGATHSIGLLNSLLADGVQPSIVYHSPDLSASLSAPQADVYANQMTVYRTGLDVSLSSYSPSGARTPSASDRIAYFNFAANTQYEVQVSQITFSLSGTALPDSGTATYYLRDSSSGQTIANGTWTYGSTENLTLTFNNPLAIPYGTSKTLRIETDTTNFKTGSAGKYYTFRLALENWLWSDSVSSSISPLSSEVPVYSNELQY